MALRKIIVVLFALLIAFSGMAYAAGDDFTFSVVSDTHLIKNDGGPFRVYPSVRRIVSDIINERPDFVVHCGDMIQTRYSKPNTDQSIRDMWDMFDESVYEPFKKAGIDMFIAKGNHDVVFNAKTIFPERWRDRKFAKGLTGEDICRYYSFEHKGCLFIFVDDSAIAMTSEQVEWLRKKVDEGRNYRAVFVVMHIGLKGSERHPDEKAIEPVRQILSEAPYRLTVLSGHHHKFDVTDFGNARNIVIGTAGKEKGGAMKMDVSVRGKEVFIKTCIY